ncbi:outer membrane beta-barrel protein [Hymenobacter rubripertinctus]|uniref:PorT family protein n=1 Tax=Hymenobacter rubripertinctus TaxID=2029981 RepID=A0A418QYN2_9BACT|nr:outer membrane beta-barrel protein [Hymenobacter rubripertinctus]RIY10248.1 PorT family protein [Hymenobacter rubripertinctus]
MPPVIRLLCILFIIPIIPATGQRLLLGVKGGATLSNGIGADAQGSTLRLGGHGGLLTRLRLPAGFALQTEALYSQRGDNATAYGSTIGQRLTYLDVPLLAQYHQQDLFVEAGGQYSWLLAQSANEPPVFRLNALAVRPREVSFVVGFGYQDTVGLSVGWRYVGGLHNVFRPGELSGSGQRQIRNGSLQFYLNYLFEPRQVVQAAVRTGQGTGWLAVATARRAAKLPVVLYQGARFVFYTGPAAVIRRLRRPPAPESAPESAPPSIP